MTKPHAATDSPYMQLATDGAAVVREFLNSDQTTALRRIVASVYDAMATCSEFSDPDMAENFKLWNGVWLRPLPDFLNGRGTLSAQYRAAVANIVKRTRVLLGDALSSLFFIYWRRRTRAMAYRCRCRHG